MLFSGGACSRRVSLFLKPFSFPRRCAKLEREREKELGVGRERENFVVVVLLCVECRGREERGKLQTSRNTPTAFFSWGGTRGNSSVPSPVFQL